MHEDTGWLLSPFLFTLLASSPPEKGQTGLREVLS